MKKCTACAAKIPAGGVYCPVCGKKTGSDITFQYREEDEKDFAFHAEYYSATGNGSDKVQERSAGSRYAWYDGRLYYLYRTRQSKCYVLTIVDEEITDSFELHVEFASGYDADILANRNGIFVVDKSNNIALYDFNGKKQFEIHGEDITGEKYKECIYYIFGDKIYFMLNAQERYDGFDDVNMCIREYNFKTDKWQDIWNLSDQMKEEERFCKDQLRAQLEYNYDCPVEEFSVELYECSLRNMYANSQYMIMEYELICWADGGSAEVVYSPVILFDFSTKKYEIITRQVGAADAGLCFDMRRNRMWYAYNKNTLAEVPLKRMCDVQRKEAERTWTFAESSYIHGIPCFSEENCYFDGEHCYVATGSYFLYAYQQDGQDVGEWNRSGHGNTAVAVHGPYVWARLDLVEDDMFCHAIHRPAQGFHMEEETAEQVIEQSRAEADRKIEEMPKPEEMWKTEEMWKPEEVQKPEEIQKPEEPEEQNRGMTISGLRAKLQECSDYAGEFKAYRNSLENRWDFNAVMGILIGSNKRSGGKKHILEQNAGIGQGDNFNRVVEALERHGLMDVYKKYEKMTDASVTLLQVEDEIMEIAPQLSDICKKISDILA